MLKKYLLQSFIFAKKRLRSNFILNGTLCNENYMRGVDVPGGNSPGEFDGDIHCGEFSCYRSTVLCDWFSSLVSRREKILEEKIDTVKETNVIPTTCSENDYKNKRKQSL